MALQSHDELRPATVRVTREERRRRDSNIPPHDLRDEFSSLDVAAVAMVIALVLGPLVAAALT